MLVLVWLGLLVALVRRPSFVPESTVANPLPIPGSVATSDPRDAWMGVYIQGDKIGYTRQRRIRGADGYRFEDQSLLRLTVLETAQTVRTSVQGEARDDHSLRSFSLSLRSGVGDLRVTGTVEANELRLTVHTGLEERQERVALDRPLYLPSSAREHLSSLGFEKGRRATLEVFDPSAMTNHPMELVVEARESLPASQGNVDAWRVRESFRGIASTVWFDDAGRVLREEGPMGLVAVRENADQATTRGWNKGAAFDLMAAVSVPVREPIENPRDLDRIELRVDGLTTVLPISDRRQSYDDGMLSIVREDPATLGTYPLPYTGPDWQAELHETPFLQVDHPRVRSTAAEILGGEADALRAAERLRRWVFDRLEKVPITSIPNALQVLEMGAGDCNEHAVLWAALARAAGLPARVVAGIVYVDGVFLYHAWNEVWLGSGWVSVDAAFDQMPVDATHVKFVEGGPEAHAAIVPLLGQLSIDVVGIGMGRNADAKRGPFSWRALRFDAST
jgi:hypothetical protein